MRDKPTRENIQAFLKTISDVAVFVVSYEGTDQVTVIDGEGKVFAALSYPGAYIEWERSDFAGTSEDEPLFGASSIAVWNNGKVLLSWDSWDTVAGDMEKQAMTIHVPRVLKNRVLGPDVRYGLKNLRFVRALWRSQQDVEK